MSAPIPTHIHEAAVAEYVAGGGAPAIAARHGINATTVYKWVRRAGHEVRTRGKKSPVESLAYVGGWVVRGGVQRPLRSRRAA